MSKDGKIILPTSYRIPYEVREALAKRAAANRRSASQELIVAIEHYLATTPDPAEFKSHKSRK